MFVKKTKKKKYLSDTNVNSFVCDIFQIFRHPRQCRKNSTIFIRQ